MAPEGHPHTRGTAPIRRAWNNRYPLTLCGCARRVGGMSTSDTHLVICPGCYGSGLVLDDYTVVTCRDCGGEGLARVQRRTA